MCVLYYGLYDVRFVVVRLADVGLVAVGLVDVRIMLVNLRLGFVD